MQPQETVHDASRGPLSRRRFLTQVGIGAGGTILACAGLAEVATYAPPVSYPESEGGAAAAKRVLVAYATARGSTGEVAQAIARTLAGRGFSVDLHPVTRPIELGGYAAVLVGSAIRAAHWLPEAVKFVQDHRDALSRIPTSYFTVCMTLAKDTEENRQRASAFLDPVRQILAPAKEGWFGGKYDPSACALWERLAVSSRHMPAGDFRDWNAIKSWAGEVLS